MHEHEPRITFQIDKSLNSQLIVARAEDGVPAAERIRAALHLWEHDPEIRRRIDQAAVNARSSERTTAMPRVKLTLSVRPDQHRTLTLGRAHDDISAAARIRAALELWRDDADARTQIDAVAANLRQSRIASRFGETGAGTHS